MQISKREKYYIFAVIVLIAVIGALFWQGRSLEPTTQAKLDERVEVPDKPRLEWETLRLAAQQKRAEAELFDLQATEKMNEMKRDVLGSNAESYEPRIDPLTGKLHFALKKKE